MKTTTEKQNDGLHTTMYILKLYGAAKRIPTAAGTARIP